MVIYQSHAKAEQKRPCLKANVRFRVHSDLRNLLTKIVGRDEMKITSRSWHPVAVIIVLALSSRTNCQLRLISQDTPTPTSVSSTWSGVVPVTSTVSTPSDHEQVSDPIMSHSTLAPNSTTSILVNSNSITVSEEPSFPGTVMLNESDYDVYHHPTIRKSFHLPLKYNKEMRPSRYGEPVSVEFEIHVQAINPIKAADMDFRMEVLFSFRWDDLRLDFEDDEFYDSDHILLPPEMIESIWHPDPYILNAKSTEVGQLTGKLIKVYIYRNHTVVYSINLFVTVACAMQFQYYPFDYQLCPMVIESFSYDETKVKFRWSKYQKFTVNPRLRLLQFVVTYPLVAEECSVHRIKEQNNVSQLIAYFRFDRLLGNHLIQTFSPCSLVTALSWLSFWFELDAIPARVSLLITSLLILVTQFSGLKVDMPPVAYVKAVDIWMAGCMIFVFSALAEFVLVKIIYSKTEDLRHMIAVSHLNGGTDTCVREDGESESSSASSTSTETSTSSITTASVRSSNCTPLVTPSAISPVMKNNQVPQRVMSKENIGGSTSTFDFNPSSTQPQTHTISYNPHPPPPITFIKTLSNNGPKLGSSLNLNPRIEHRHTTGRRIPSILNMKMPFCWGYLAVPLIWTNEKTKKTHLLWKELDVASRWIFPFTFCLFLVVYWLVLFVHSQIYSPPTHYGTC